MKQEKIDRLLLAISRVLSGAIYVSDQVAAHAVQRLAVGGGAAGNGTTEATKSLDAYVQRLTDRELQVFRMIGRGLGTRLIAETLHLSRKNHRKPPRAHQDQAWVQGRQRVDPTGDPVGAGGTGRGGFVKSGQLWVVNACFPVRRKRSSDFGPTTHNPSQPTTHSDHLPERFSFPRNILPRRRAPCRDNAGQSRSVRSTASFALFQGTDFHEPGVRRQITADRRVLGDYGPSRRQKRCRSVAHPAGAPQAIDALDRRELRQRAAQGNAGRSRARTRHHAARRPASRVPPAAGARDYRVRGSWRVPSGQRARGTAGSKTARTSRASRGREIRRRPRCCLPNTTGRWS